MASTSRALPATTLLLSLNLLFFKFVISSTELVPCSSPSKPPPEEAKCPRDTLKLGVCVDMLKGLLGLVVGTPPKTPCCSLIEDLADIEAAVCLCTAIKANLLGINLDVPLSLTLLLNYCGKNVPYGYQCAN